MNTKAVLMRLFVSAALTVLALIPLPASAVDTQLETSAQAAWVYDVGTDTVLLEKNADLPLPPASMSKLMTLNMLFEALRDGRVSLDTTFSVSTRARELGGSTMFLQESDRPTVAELIQGIIVNSGNDACVVVAEGLAGSEDLFARQMTARARALGMTHSTFANASGWPAPDHRMSLRDLGILAQRLITEFPQYYPIFSQQSFDYKGRAPANAQNRNPLLALGAGADGLKTGHTDEAGYGLVGSAVRGERRVIFVISGLEGSSQRAEEAERILNWSMRQFVEKTVARAGVSVAEAEVWLGSEERVGLAPAHDVSVLIPALGVEEARAEVLYEGPLTTPIAAGAQVATLRVHIPGMDDIEVPLLAQSDVGEAGVWKRFKFVVARFFGADS